MNETIEAIVRPNGKLYRPRSIRYQPWDNDNHYDGLCGVIVLGTHDVDRAKALAEEGCQHWYGLHADRPDIDWFRLTYVGGELVWTRDAERGAAGIKFTAVDWYEPPGGAGDA